MAFFFCFLGRTIINSLDWTGYTVIQYDVISVYN